MAGEHAGQRLIEMLWEQLDAQYNRLKELHAVTPVTAERLAGWMEESIHPDEREDTIVDARHAVDYLQQQGKVQGLCFAVGTITYPYDDPKDRIEKVRAELPQRWADAYGEEEEDD
jgi:hypothetical protein